MEDHEDLIFEHLYSEPPTDPFEREQWELERRQVLGGDR